ncbi:YlqD family protein [Veillonella sp. YH-vei2232]|jgi:transposase|uniref:YlqD family protein n=1 Tax=Veillonella absiana TaxID=3079305 RepID=A0ABU3Z9Y5_9FIRM|nr:MULTISPECIES: YlqD family protein [unclassified Veillonella]MBP8617403.1 YlqD family protein [Veillonella sp.]MBP9517455.1 YlqD family protein [Veillonella sp.]MDV5063943.1 YlqD family protein [Veillonella sp. YH-vei2232]MDV5088736.1 YlqD family protein [Veillonella sp. YH-vei2233]
MEEMTLRVPVTVKAKVTEDFKAKIIADLQSRLEMVEQDLQQIEFQAKRLLSEQAKIDAQGLVQIRQQIDAEQQKRLAFKEDVTAKLKEAQELTIGTEVPQGNLEQQITVKVGDDLNAMMGAEILLEDGKIIAFRQ